jgi:SNF2 family DNA or RNA helicase
VVTHGDREYRENALGMDVDFYIANHDMIRHKEVATIVRKRKDIDLIILDEASFFRNARNLSYKFLAWATENKKRIWFLTGTPCPNAPTDAWALARIICPERVPRFFGHFQRKTMVPVGEYKWRPIKGAEQIVFDALQPAWRIKKKDCMSLPPLTIANRQTQLTADQAKAFKLMRDYMILQYKTTKVTAVNAADALIKLRQICCGSVKNGDDTYESIDHSTRLNELIAVINEASAKVVAIVPFKGIIRALEAELAKHFTVAVLNGDVTPKARIRIIREFKTQPDPHLLLCHPRVMSHGLNLTEADTTVFYAPIYSHDEYAQVIERFNRAGQTRKMTVVRIAAHPFEWDIYRLLDNRAINQDNILKLYERIIQ